MTRTIFFRLLLHLPLALIVSCTGLGGEPNIVGQIPSESSNNSEASPDDIGVVMTLGGEVWAQNCTRCHGDMGAGTPDGAPLPDLSAYTDEQILASITNGVHHNGMEVMPAFGGQLATDELEAVRTYAKMMSIAMARGMVNTDTNTASPTQIVQAPASTPEATDDGGEQFGFVAGTVSNGSSGGGLPGNLTVRLHVIKSELIEEVIEGTTDANGAYILLDVPFEDHYQYVVTVGYNGMMFVSEIVPGASVSDPANPSLDMPITIYEITTDPTSVIIDTINAQAFVQDDVLQVVQIVRFTNVSDRVFFQFEGELPETSMFVRVPEGATFFDQVATDYLLSADGTRVYSTMPLMPGRSQTMHIAYMLAYSSGVSVTQTFDYAINGRVDVALVNNGLTLTGEGLPANGTIDMGGRALATYGSVIRLAAGEPFAYTLTGTPIVETVSGGSTLNPLAYVLIGAGVTALVIAGVLTLRDRRAHRGSNASQASDKNKIAQLMEQIASLDALHRDGKLDAREYTRRRDALKAQLSALMNLEPNNEGKVL